MKQRLISQVPTATEAPEGRPEKVSDGGGPKQLSFHWYPVQGGAGADPDEPLHGASESTIQSIRDAYRLPYHPCLFSPSSEP